jgi:hypothetical protein
MLLDDVRTSFRFGVICVFTFGLVWALVRGEVIDAAVVG